MTDKEYIAEVFKRLDEKIDYKIDLVMAELKNIKEQTTKTNGRVTDLEDDVSTLQQDGLKHTINCPVRPDLERIDRELEDYRFLVKYPKVILLAIAMIVLTIIYNVYNDEVIKSKMEEIHPSAIIKEVQ